MAFKALNITRGDTMRRILCFIAIGLTGGAFILLCLIWILKINALIPILMFAAAFVILGIVKRMHELNNAVSDTNDIDDSAK